MEEAGGADKFAMVMTDNAANMKLARQLLLAREGHTHLLEMRCFMHAFGLVLRDILAHPTCRCDEAACISDQT